MKPIVPAVVVLGLSASVLQGCGAVGLWACGVPVVDGHAALEAAMPTATAQQGRRKAGKNFTPFAGIPYLFRVT